MLANALNGSVLNSGDLLRDHLRNMRIPVEDDIATGSIFIERLGEAAVGEVIAERAAALSARIIDGVRLYSSYEILRHHGLSPVIVHITSLPAIRVDRFVSRSLTDGSATTRTEAEHMLCSKDQWNADLNQFQRSARWCFDNSGTWAELGDFTASVANIEAPNL